MTVDLYPHQLDAVQKMKNGCILCGGVGTGKSRTGLAFYAINNGMHLYSEEGCVRGALNSPRPLFIITTAKKRDSREWEEECLNYGILNVKIDSWNNIKKYVNVYGAFFIFDEQRVVGWGAWSKAFIKITRKNYWILLSATPGDTWTDYIPVFVANGFYRNKTEFLSMHAIYNSYSKYPKIDRFVGTGRLTQLRSMILVNMPYRRSTTAHYISFICNYDKALYKKVWKDRWDPYDNCPIEEVGKLCYLLRRVVNSDKSRLEYTESIVKSRSKIIIFYNYTYELNLLKDYFRDYTIGEWNGERHEPIPTSDKWIYLVQYSAGAEGWNCVETDTILFFSQSYSYRMTVQAAGRIDRLNTEFKDLYYYTLRSTSPIDLAIKRALDMKKDFNVKSFVKH